MGGVCEVSEKGRSRAGEEQVRSKRIAGAEQARSGRRAGAEQVRSKSRAGEGLVGSWDDGSVLGHLFRFLVSLRPFVKLIICREDEG